MYWINDMLSRCLLLLVLSLSSGFARAEPLVIYDSGRGVATASYKQVFNNDDIRDFRDSWIFGDLPKPDQPDEPATIKVYPITTTRLTPKRMEKPLEGYFPRMLFPVCVVGDDALSLEWLERNRRHLADTGAQCFIVSARSAETAEPLLRLLEGIVVYPANGDALADYFKIQHYPVLITDRYATQ